MIGLYLVALAASSAELSIPQSVVVSEEVSYALHARQEVRNGKTYNVLLAPSCKNKVPKCKPFQREWTDKIKLLPGDIITPEGLILREVKS
jgi:hypothetical protein